MIDGFGSALPHDSRGFIHKKDSFLRKAASFIPGPIGAAVSMIPDFGPQITPRISPKRAAVQWKPGTPGRCISNPANTACDSWRLERQPPMMVTRTAPPRPSPTFATSFAPSTETAGCLVPGMRRDPRTGQCAFFLGTQTGRDPVPVGDAVMGQYGAGMVPGNMIIDRAICLRGMVLGNDGICYNRKTLRNSDREWPRGARPLGTPEEMRALRIASRFAGRLDRSKDRIRALKRAL